MFENSQEIIDKNLSVTMKRIDAGLTARENEVLLLLAKGLNRDEIASKLFVSPETVKMHIKNIYKKLKAKNKVDALIKMKML
jgi:LuxR family transcriptional regulator of csgAB operon